MNFKSKPVFIVGAPRSGTTMLAAMIGSHSEYAIGPETQFFSKLAPATLEASVADENWPQKAIETLYELTLADQYVVELFGSNKTRLYDFLKSRPPSMKAMLEALTIPFAVKRSKSGWAEKTPNHIRNVYLIRSIWPDAKIIRIMRDPRDAVLSTCRLPTFSNSFLANLYLWRTWQDDAQPFFEQDKDSKTIRYEDLVSDATQILTELCEFIGVGFEKDMLNFSNTASDVSTSNEVWKKSVSQTLTTNRCFAWKKTLDYELRKISSDVTHEHLVSYNYEFESTPERTTFVYRMAPNFVEKHEEFLKKLTKRGIRWLPTEKVEKADRIVGQPEYRRFRNPVYYLKLIWDRLFVFTYNLFITHKGAS